MTVRRLVTGLAALVLITPAATAAQDIEFAAAAAGRRLPAECFELVQAQSDFFTLTPAWVNKAADLAARGAALEAMHYHEVPPAAPPNRSCTGGVKKVTHRFLPHTADIKVAFEAESLDALLAEGLVVLRGLLAAESPVEPRERRAISVRGTDPTELFLVFLRELLYLHGVDGFLPAGFEFASVTETAVEGTLLGETSDPTRHAHQPEVKAVTRHGLVVEKVATKWRAEVVFDV